MADITLFVGLDVHKKTIAVALADGTAGAAVRFYGTIANTPDAVRTLLPHLQLIDVFAGGRFRYRLTGTALVEAFGRDYTGQYLDELFDGPRAQAMRDVYCAVRDARQPMFLRSRYLTTKDVDLVANRVYLPLSADGREVDMILGALTFDFGTVASVAGVWGSARLAPSGSALEMVEARGVSAS